MDKETRFLQMEENARLLRSHARGYCVWAGILLVVSMVCAGIRMQPWIEIPFWLMVVTQSVAVGGFLGTMLCGGVGRLILLHFNAHYPRERIFSTVCFLVGLAMFLVVTKPSPWPDPLKPHPARAKTETRAIVKATVAYIKDTGQMPDRGGGGDGPASMRIIEALIGENLDERNPKRKVYLTIKPRDNLKNSRTDGTFLDPWGTQYTILLDDVSLFRRGQTGSSARKTI